MDVVDVLVPAVVAFCLLALFGGVLMARAGVLRRPPLVSPEDAAELDAVGRSLLVEHHDDVAAQLRRVLETLRRRRVPLTRVTAAGGIRGQGVLVFADGTRIVARSVSRPDLGTVAVAVLRHRVLLRSWSDDGRGLAVELVWSAGRRTVEAVAVAVSE
jgi:hypothetical protein